MVFTLKKTLLNIYGKHRLEFLVAPYEADSQLAYLNKIGYVDFVITEDSDLIVFGAIDVFYKMDSDFYGEVFIQKNLKLIEEMDIRRWHFDKFI